MNSAIRRAVESFNDDKIQYIDINPAFEGHRFCEPGQTKLDQYNWGNKVHFWNQPAKWFTTVTNGDKVKHMTLFMDHIHLRILSISWLTL
jgi:ribosomal protein L21E